MFYNLVTLVSFRLSVVVYHVCCPSREHSNSNASGYITHHLRYPNSQHLRDRHRDQMIRQGRAIYLPSGVSVRSAGPSSGVVVGVVRHPVDLLEAVRVLLEIVAGGPHQDVAGLLRVAAGLVRDVAESLDVVVEDSHVCLAVDSHVSCVSALSHTHDREGCFSCS